MTDPVVAQKAPFGVKVEEGKSYWWCACGLSKEQPFCDGSHKGTGIEPSNIRQKNQARCIFVVVRTPKTFRFAMAPTLNCEQADVAPST